MNKTWKGLTIRLVVVVLLILGGYVFLGQQASAQTCSGSISVNYQDYSCDMIPAIGYVCADEGIKTRSLACSNVSGSCFAELNYSEDTGCNIPPSGASCTVLGYADTVVGNVANGSCYWSGASVPQTCPNGIREGTETCDDNNTVCGDGCCNCQTEGACSSGDCFEGISNCGEVGRVAGTGTCGAGGTGLCCSPPGGSPSCPFDPSNPPNDGSGVCKIEGQNVPYPPGVCVGPNSRNGNPCTWPNECSADGCDWASPTPCTCRIPSANQCCSGLVKTPSNICVCPASCSIVATAASLNLDAGDGQLISAFITSSANKLGTRFYTSNPAVVTTNPFQDTVQPYSSTITAVGPGSAVVTSRGYVQRDAVIATCDYVTTVNVTATCDGPSFVASPGTTCAPTETMPGSITFSWSPQADATGYDIDVLDDTNTIVENNAAQPPATFGCGSGTCSYTANLAPGSYHARLVSSRTSCGVSDPVVSASGNFGYCPYSISGRVYTDSAGLDAATPQRCVPVGTNAWTEVGTSSVTLTGGGLAAPLNTPVQGDGSFSASVPGSDNDYVVTLNLNPPVANTWAATCPGNRVLLSQVGPADDNTVNFFVGGDFGGWLQTQGGSIHAEGGRVSNITPECSSSDTTTCTALLDSASTANSTGHVSYTDTPLDLGGNDFDAEGRNRSINTNPRYQLQNYAYFYRLFEMPLSPVDYFANLGGTEHLDAREPNGASTPTGVYYRNGDLTIRSQNWSIDSSESKVILINGNLTIDTGTTRRITVAGGGFLAFVVKGSINITPATGQADPTSTTPIMEGIYLADGNINIQAYGAPTQDNKLVVGGSLLSHSGINFDREYHNAFSQTQPAELVIFRPDLVSNTPLVMKKSLFWWQELRP